MEIEFEGQLQELACEYPDILSDLLASLSSFKFAIVKTLEGIPKCSVFDGGEEHIDVVQTMLAEHKITRDAYEAHFVGAGYKELGKDPYWRSFSCEQSAIFHRNCPKDLVEAKHMLEEFSTSLEKKMEELLKMKKIA